MKEQEYLSFMLEQEEYAVPILLVREVRGWTPVRSVPNSPPFVVGVLEIRGEYVPIVDLRARFNLSNTEIAPTTVVIVLNNSQHQPFGIIVDAVSEVYALTSQAIKSIPTISAAMDDRFIEGIAPGQSGHLIIINLEALFDMQELSPLSVQQALA